MNDIYGEHENRDPETGEWKLTLPPPKVGDACVLPHVVLGSELRWSAHWVTDGCGGSCYFMALAQALESVGRYVTRGRK